MNESEPISISIIEPISEAIEKTKQILFNPFDWKKWFAIGFCAWLANLCQGGGSGGGNMNGFQNDQGQVTAVRDTISTHLPLVITIGSIIFVLVVTIIILCLWLSSRGRFMFLNCVAKNTDQVKLPWNKYREQGNSLFLFRLTAGIISFVCIAVLGGLVAIAVVMLKNNSATLIAPAIVMLVLALLILLPTIIAVSLLFKFTKDFVVPIMYLKGTKTIQAWKDFLELLRNNKLNLLLYILFQILITICITIIIVALTCLTCCIAGCILALPYIGTVLLLPVFVFCRSYSLCYLRQYGSQFDVFSNETNISEEELILPE
ncbi:MAG: hypothetical protein JW912_05350 [Sedimentisphaerales bacterium]|nr:hypothetical protein [Sedimentisphaerales bacterium]